MKIDPFDSPRSERGQHLSQDEPIKRELVRDGSYRQPYWRGRLMVMALRWNRSGLSPVHVRIVSSPLSPLAVAPRPTGISMSFGAEIWRCGETGRRTSLLNSRAMSRAGSIPVASVLRSRGIAVAWTNSAILGHLAKGHPRRQAVPCWELWASILLVGSALAGQPLLKRDEGAISPVGSTPTPIVDSLKDSLKCGRLWVPWQGDCSPCTGERYWKS